MPVRFLRSAQADIRAEKLFYRNISPELAVRFQTAVHIAVQAIAFQPLAMQVIELNIRRWPVDSGFPHGILYHVEEREILVLAVFHPKQDPGVEATMLPVGYMAKRVTVRPDWIKAERVSDIYSVSGCVSEDFTDYINYWKHNGYWFFDSPQTILELAQQNSIDLTGTILFFYEAYELEFDDVEGQWTTFKPEPSFKTEVFVPNEKAFEDYDVVTFSVRTSAECSPLSCNSLASEVETNGHCLLPSLERAKELLEEGNFKNTEPGRYRIFAVYSIEWP